MNAPEQDRFIGMPDEAIILNPREAKSPDCEAIFDEKRRIVRSGVSPFDLVDLAEFKRWHPEAT